MFKENKTKARYSELSLFANYIGIKVKNFELLNMALTHGSSLRDKEVKSSSDNERLEFFGDAVLKLFISEYLMNRYTNYSEGQLSKLRAFVVSEKVLAKIAVELDFNKYILLGKNESKSIPVSILADALEAVLAVIYYDCGPEEAKEFILTRWLPYIENADSSNEKDNYKAVLQEILQADKQGLPTYKTISESGPDHSKRFEVGVFLNNSKLATGIGKTKKEASQEAARSALIVLNKTGNMSFNRDNLNSSKIKNPSRALKSIKNVKTK